MDRRRNYNRRDNKGKKEKAIMLASAVFVLTALTLTGVYVKESAVKEEDDGYIIDFAKLEEEDNSEENKYVEEIQDRDNTLKMAEGELDYSPLLEEADSGVVKNLGVDEEDEENTEEMTEDATENETEEDAIKEIETASTENVTVIQEDLNFTEGDSLIWPVVGNVLINYSMDKTVYFATLEQYKYNPGIVIEATESDMITAAANGKVLEVYKDDELGNVVKMNIGNGYEVLYGQLKDIQVSEGSYVQSGDLIGYVSAPTKYYAVEGCNVFFALYKDGVAINPMTCLGN